jgi:predicted ATP-grasp superfamily ATP-dependent carboligase
VPICLAAVGFSARALVSACAAAGLQPLSVDAFADFDCRQLTTASLQVKWSKANSEVETIVAWLDKLGQCRNKNRCNLAVLLGGGCENWLQLVDCLGERFTLLGPIAKQIEALRDPAVWKMAAEESGLRFPPIRLQVDETLDGPLRGWLEKPFCSAGGVQVQRLGDVTGRENSLHRIAVPRKGCYFQAFIPGHVLGAHFVCQPEPRLMGLTESFQCSDWPGPSEFIYRGSWGPVHLSELAVKDPVSLGERLLNTARALQKASGLRGWMQLDLVLDNDGQLWLLEVNPRWSSGMEVLVDSGMENPVLSHLAAFEFNPSNFQRNIGQAIPAAGGRVAKAVVYAAQPLRLTAHCLAAWHAKKDGLADVPPASAAGEVIQTGYPVVTVKAKLDRRCGGDLQGMRQQLRERLAERRRAVVEAASLLGTEDSRSEI